MASLWLQPRTAAPSTSTAYVSSSSPASYSSNLNFCAVIRVLKISNKPSQLLQALNNGLLVDPHDDKAIADALLNLVADKNLWTECRKNGWKNIHLFSWPEHCRTYLTRIAACRMRHPQWQVDTPLDAAAEESFNDSLTEFQESSLRLSLDGDLDKKEENPDINSQVKKILNKIKNSTGDGGGGGESVATAADGSLSRYPLLRRRRRLFVIALDWYDDSGNPDRRLLQAIQEIFKAVKLDSQLARISGFALSTAMPIAETLELLKSGRIRVSDFDALICSGGSEVYYPGTTISSGDDGEFRPDPDYAAHIEYRWERHGVRRTTGKLLALSEENQDPEEDVRSSGPHCVSFFVNDPSTVT